MFNHLFSGQNFSAIVNFPILAAKFDPDLWILSNNNTITGTTNYTFNDQINIFPNPTAGNISLLYQLRNQQDLLIELTDVTGRKIIDKTENIPAGPYSSSENIELLASGVYVLKITGKGINYSQKVVKK